MTTRESPKKIICFGPVYNERSKVLILGSMPSVKSLQHSFYYMHPTNRFWKVIAQICKAEFPNTIGERRKLALDNRIALWDVIYSCNRKGSLDSNIKNVVVNDIPSINNIENMKIFANGKLAYNLFCKHFPQYEIEYLPATSSANVRFDMDKWMKIKKFI